MSTTVDVILGAAYGDEGKGRVTDHTLKELENAGRTPVCIRFSGGQQAGHTVVRNGIKHTHSSFGAGTLSGFRTYVTEHCTIYPPAIINERDALIGKGINPQPIVVHPLAKLTTPWDIAYNRATAKNDTCGMGIGATMKRHEQHNIKIYAIDLYNQVLLEHKLDQVEKYYFNLLQLDTPGHHTVGKSYREHLEKLLPQWNKIGADVYSRNVVEPNKTAIPFQIQGYDFLEQFDSLVFEGSQGIMLDMDFGAFPYVTYAKTTSKNVMDVCNKLGIPVNMVTVTYVTRSYLTRHGAGPLYKEGEEAEIKLINNEGEINVNNNWQGGFRTAPLSTELLEYTISLDMSENDPCKLRTYKLAVTCMDQLPYPDLFSKGIGKILGGTIKFFESPENTN